MSAVPAYKPRAGSVAESAMLYLEANGPTKGTELADAVESDNQSLYSSMNLACERGVAIRYYVEGAVWYRLPGQPLHESDARVKPASVITGAELAIAVTMPKASQSLTMADVAEMTFEGRDSQHVLKVEAARPDATDRENAPASPVGGPTGVGQAAAAAPAGGIRVALWSDKRLQIGETLYTVEETRAIVDYLDAIAREVVQ